MRRVPTVAMATVTVVRFNTDKKRNIHEAPSLFVRPGDAPTPPPPHSRTPQNRAMIQRLIDIVKAGIIRPRIGRC